MRIKFHNPNMPTEDSENYFDGKKPLFVELDFDNDIFTLRQDGNVTISGELSSCDTISFSK